MKLIPKDYYWPLFEHIDKEHGICMHSSEMYEIILIVKRMIADELSTKITEALYKDAVRMHLVKFAIKEIIEKP